MSVAEDDRSYGGVPLGERRAKRREQLVEAALDLLAENGYDATTVKDVCRRARLTERYFYEHFADRVALLAAVYEHVVSVVMAATFEAIGAAPDELEARVRAGLDAFLGSFERDPRLARVQLLEAVGRDPAMERRRREVLHAYAELLARQSDELAPRDDIPELGRRVGALGLVGATNEVAIDWVQGDLSATRAELVDHLTRVYLAVARAPA